MSVTRVLRFAVSCTGYTIAAAILLTVLPGLPPYYQYKPINFPGVPSDLPEPKFVLDGVKTVVEGVFGPESIAIKDKALYTGLEDGRIVRIDETAGGKAQFTVLSQGTPCDFAKGFENTGCTRPLGVRFDPEGNLVFADMARGLVKVNIATGQTQELDLGSTQRLSSNDLSIAKDGTIYWSIVGAHGATIMEQLLEPSGMLLKYEPKTKKVTTLLSNITMANGVQLSENEDFVLVNELPFGRTIRYYLKGPKAGSSDVFVEGLPGTPDNIRPNGKGGYYIALFSNLMPLVTHVWPYPSLLKLVSRVQWILLKFVSSLNSLNIVNPMYLEYLGMYIGMFGPLGMEFNAKATIVEVGKDGNILGIFKARDQEINGVTQMTIGEEYAYLGSFFGDKIWKIRLSDLQN